MKEFDEFMELPLAYQVAVLLAAAVLMVGFYYLTRNLLVLLAVLAVGTVARLFWRVWH